MAETPDFLGDAMGAALGAAQDALSDAGTLPSLVHLVPGGQVAWDSCCESGGQLYVRAVTVYPSRSFPQQVLSTRCDAPMLVARLAVGVIRCVSVVNEQGVPPSALKMTQEALQITHDSALLYEALACRLDPEKVPGMIGRAIETWTPQGAEGGCAGGEWTFLVGLSTCACIDHSAEETP